MIENTKLLLLDLDGTVYLGDKVIGGVPETLDRVREKGIKIVFLTNNSSITSDAYREKLTRMRLMKEGDAVYSSLDGAVDFLKRERAGKSVYPVATAAVKNYIAEQGIKVSFDADIVLLAFDREITYDKIVRANELLVYGREYISTHPDMVCPAQGVSVPDAGSFIRLFEGSAKRTPDIIIGKPYSVMAQMLTETYKVPPESVTMVGDRLNTDIAFGKNNGFNAVLVLSGESTLKTLEESKVKPDAVLKDLNGITDYIK